MNPPPFDLNPRSTRTIAFGSMFDFRSFPLDPPSPRYSPFTGIEITFIPGRRLNDPLCRYQYDLSLSDHAWSPTSTDPATTSSPSTNASISSASKPDQSLVNRNEFMYSFAEIRSARLPPVACCSTSE